MRYWQLPVGLAPVSHSHSCCCRCVSPRRGSLLTPAVSAGDPSTLGRQVRLSVLGCNCFSSCVLVHRSLSVSRVECLFFSVPWSLATKPCVCVCVCVCARARTPACLTPCDPVGCSPAGFSRHKYWSGLLCPPPGDLPNPGTEPVSPVLAGRFFTTAPPELAFKLDSLGDSSSWCHAPQAGNPES